MRHAAAFAPFAIVALAAAPVHAQETALRDALLANRHSVRLNAGELTGGGGRLLLDAGRDARFFLIGEQHGVAEVPLVSAALFTALAPHGYRHLAIETGFAVAAQVNALLAGADGEASVPGEEVVAAFVEAHYPGLPFYALREEAWLLGQAVRAAGGKRDVLWGLDYDIMADRYTLQRLRALAPDAAARAVADRTLAYADSLLAAAIESGNPSRIFMFGGDPGRLAALREAFAPTPGSDEDRLLALMEETLAINYLFASDNYASNVRRSTHLKQQFLRHYAAAVSAETPAPRVMLKFGANHAIRGRNFTNAYDLGALAHELAEADGARAFGVYVIGGRGDPFAAFDPATLGYRAMRGSVEPWAEPFHDHALDDGWTLYDLRPVRAAAAAGVLGVLPDALTRVIFGFDAVLVLAGSSAATPLIPGVPATLHR